MLQSLTLGRGSSVFDVFLEPTCPFSARVFSKLPSLIDTAGSDMVSVRIWLHSQPWHMYSGVLCRAIAAAANQDPEGSSALDVMEAIFRSRGAYEFDAHCRGPLLNTSPHQLLSRLVEESGVDFWEAFDDENLQTVIKQHAKFSRQNGIHVSPTVMFNGLIVPDISSGDAVQTWLDKAGLATERYLLEV